ncbi:MAG TPA: hypothetical protein VNG12_01670 [Acidimicrobiales bacterium]|nr:hypothetical protein [Acidimicrobiales bacterium]HVA05426.1 hypothetical protein [Acidimicrobiales bacterium]
MSGTITCSGIGPNPVTYDFTFSVSGYWYGVPYTFTLSQGGTQVYSWTDTTHCTDSCPNGTCAYEG